MSEHFDPELPSKWTPSAQEKFLEMMSVAGDQKVWYCTRGRICDGNPHDGYDYQHARSDQWPPSLREDWMFWILASGRGSGKSRSGAEWLRSMTRYTGRLCMIAPTAADLRDTMVEGESGILRVCENAGYQPDWSPSKRRLTFPNGAICIGYTAEEPDRLRGRNDGAGWLDEPAHYPNVQYVWDMFMYGLRHGKHPRVAITTTPTPSDWLRTLLADEASRVTVVSTFANAKNLAPAFIDQMRKKYDGTRQGRQELYGELLEDVEGALWHGEMLDATRRRDMPELVRTVVAVDPAGTSAKRSDITGIVVCGKGHDGNLYALADYSGQYTPREWALAALRAMAEWDADAIVAETNYGGEMVLSNIRHNVEQGAVVPRLKAVNSRRGKFIRAEPVFALFEQDRAHMLGHLPDLEAQLCSWVPGSGKSPDRMDAMVHGFHELAQFNDGSIAVARGRLATPSNESMGSNYKDFTKMLRGALPDARRS